MRKSEMGEFDVIRHHLGELRPSESDKVKMWAKESEENAKEFVFYKKIIQAVSSLQKWQSFHWKKAWKHISSRL